MPRAIRLAAVLLLSLSLGLHWAVLQSVAWTTMLIERTQNASFSVALQTTFDGRHPCQICKAVAAGKSAEKSPVGNRSQVKLELLATGSVTPSISPSLPALPPRSAAIVLRSRSEVPALPPPRV